jgi:hypothetical protein
MIGAPVKPIPIPYRWQGRTASNLRPRRIGFFVAVAAQGLWKSNASRVGCDEAKVRRKVQSKVDARFQSARPTVLLCSSRRLTIGGFFYFRFGFAHHIGSVWLAPKRQ